jgi:hypothetical protein
LDSIETITASNIARISSLENISASNIARISSLETTSASVDTLNTTQNTRLSNLEIKTGSLATTGSNTFIGTQTITGSLYITTDLIVQGSSSLQNITASAVSIGTNIINLNTANPAIRYAGLVIGDSGSVGSSGSFLYDSVQDEFIFVHRGANTTVTSSVVLMGPQTYDNIGNETYLTTNIIPKGAGNEHLVDSNISDTGTLVSINSATSSFSGSVGIGTTNPNQTLHVVGNTKIYNGVSTTRTFIDLQGGRQWYIVSDASGGGSPTVASGFIIRDESIGADRMVINASGNVGIGTNSPATTLHVDSSSGGIVRVTRLGAGSAYTQIESDGSNGTIASSTNLSINAGGGNRIYVSGSGQIGIGTVTPKSKLQIGSNLFFDDEGSVYYGQLSFGRVIPTGVIINSSHHAFQLQNYQGKLNLQIYKGNGNSETTHQFSGSAFGINREDPVYALDVATNSTNTFKAFRIQSVDDALITLGSTVASSQNWTFGASSNTSGQGANLFFIGTSNSTASSVSQKLTINSSGYVGIGTTNPGDILDVRRNQNGTTNFYFRNTDTTNASSRAYLNVVAGNSSISLLALHNDNLFIAGTSGKDLYFQQSQGGTVNMVITSTGVVRPGANGTQDFGTSSYRWGTIYTSDLSLSNGIGDYTIVEGEDDLFLYNNKRDKVYKFALIEVDPTTATPKKS